MILRRAFTVALIVSVALATACSDDSTGPPPAASSDAGIRLVTPAEAEAIHADPPSDLVVLDVRTPEEFAEGHLDGALMLDFYEIDFAERLAELDPDVPYLLYCRSGNRSGQTTAILQELGFTDVAEIDGGAVAWAQAGGALVAG